LVFISVLFICVVCIYSICNTLLQGPVWIREKWELAGVKWADFLPEDKVDEFVKANVSSKFLWNICYMNKLCAYGNNA
jgi:hypothetical protein